MRTPLFVLILAHLAVLPTTAAERNIPSWFSKLDRDGNGSLNRAEASRLFEPMDTNRDGKVTIEEGLAYLQTRNRGTNRGGRRREPLRSAGEIRTKKKTGNGLWIVSIGHSCIIPAVVPFSQIAIGEGYANHTHLMQFFGGAGGAAKAQWNRTEAQQQAKPALATGKIDVLTFGHFVRPDEMTQGCEEEDYVRWIEFALKKNPETRFYIQDLWSWLPMEGRRIAPVELDIGTYRGKMQRTTRDLTKVVHELNRRFPGKVNVLPAGPAMVELVDRVLRKELPGVDAIMVEPKDAAERIGLLRDMIHPTEVLASLQGYIYYACLYRKDPRKLESGIYRDGKLDKILREVAWCTVVSHPLSGVTE